MPALIATVPQAKPVIDGRTHNAFLAGKKVWAEEKVVLGLFSFVIHSGADAAFIIPTSFVGAAASYHWRINWNDGSSEQTVSGTSAAANTSGIPHSFPKANTEYTVSIDPVTPGVGSLRAFGFTTDSTGSLAVANKAKLRRIVRHPPLMAFCLSATDSGDATLGHTFRGCAQLTNALEEIMEGSETLTRIGHNFLSGMYYGCTALRTPAAEAIPAGITTIGNFFRQDQYLGTGVTSAAAEVLPSGLTGALGTYFRTAQYSGCISLSAPAAEVLPAGITSIGNFFRFQQYYQCRFVIPAAEVIPSSVTSIGSSFREQQYGSSWVTQGAKEVIPPSVITIGGNFRRHQYNSAALLVGGYIHHHRFPSLLAAGSGNFYRMFYWGGGTPDTMPRYYLDDTETTTAPVNDLTPPGALDYVRNRTGIEGYADLHPNWK